MESQTKETAAANVRRRRANKAYLILGLIGIVVAGSWFVHRTLTKGKQATTLAVSCAASSERTSSGARCCASRTV